MAQRVFIKVVGFDDAERHALNTVFRLSEEGEITYVLWAPDAPEPPRLTLLDATSYEARLEAESPSSAALKLVWVGDAPPANAWRTFPRPIAWPEVISVMDQFFAPELELDFDLDLGIDFDLEGDGFQDSVLEGTGAAPPRALIACADLDERLYLRAKLALAKLPLADEAETAAQALQLARERKYKVALVDIGLSEANAWDLVRQLTQAAIPHLILTKDKATVAERIRGRLAGAAALFTKPADPVKLQHLLDRYGLEQGS